MATATKAVREELKGKAVPIQKPTIRCLFVTIEGTTPLLQNPKTADYIKSIIDSGQGNAQPGKVIKNPEKDFKDRIRKAGDVYLHPVEAFTGQKGVFPSAAKVARLKKISSKAVLMGIKIQRDCLEEFADGIRPYVRIQSEKGPVMDMHVAEIKSGMRSVPVPIYRPRFEKGWRIDLRINYWPDLVSQSNLMSLLAHAGELGIGSWRPENGGTFGMFKVIKAMEVESFPPEV